MGRQSFGKYEVLARLATGGAASIFLARQPGAAGFNKLVCLKTLLPERASDEDFVRMFLDEARLAARLHHPNCVQIYDLGRVEQVYYISMEYIFGETLWNLLTTVTRLKTPLPPTHVAAIIANVCDGLHHAHELQDKAGKPLNLVHRDVSPQNVMISFEGQTKVVDFGIAKAETDRPPTVTGIVKGKFSYMSPEQITGNPVDRRSDIYSLGIVMFECLASRRLYRGDTPEEIARLILEHRAPRLRDVVPDIPKPLDDICARALSRHPQRRFQSAQAMGQAIRSYLEAARFNGSATIISRLMSDRFGEIVPRRRKAYEDAMTGEYDEAFLCEALGATPARYIDLYAEESSPSIVGPVAQPADLRALAKDPLVMPEPETRADPSPGAPPVSRLDGPGWQVEVESEGVESTPEQIRASADVFEVAPTRVGPEAPATRSDEPMVFEEEPLEEQTRVQSGVDGPFSSPFGATVANEPDLWESVQSGGSGEETVTMGEDLDRIFKDSTPFDDIANDLTAHPGLAEELARRLSDNVPDAQDLTATVQGDEDSDPLVPAEAARLPGRPPALPRAPSAWGPSPSPPEISLSGQVSIPPVPPVPRSGSAIVTRSPPGRSHSDSRMSGLSGRPTSGVEVVPITPRAASLASPPAPVSRAPSFAGSGLGPLVAMPPRGEPVAPTRPMEATPAGRPGVSISSGARPRPDTGLAPWAQGRYSLLIVVAALLLGLVVGVAGGVAMSKLAGVEARRPPGRILPATPE